MKKIILLSTVLFTALLGVKAQHRSIEFERNNTWKQVVRKAKQDKKLIFVDCYTSWCGPCKYLATHIFTRDSVADFFNEHFINVKYDMEKDADAPLLKDKFGVKAYPTLVFVDPKSQEVVHRMVGGGQAGWLISNGRQARDPENNLAALIKQYEAGERGGDFLKRYLPALNTAYMKDEVAKVAGGYLDILSVEELATPENWELIERHVRDPLAPSLKAVMAHRDLFYTIAGEKAVDKKLTNSLNTAVSDLAAWLPTKKKPFDEEYHEKIMQYLLEIDFEAAPAGLATLYTAAYMRAGDFQGMMKKIDEVLSYNLFRKDAKLNYLRNSLSYLLLCDEPELVERGIEWVDLLCRESEDYLDKSNLMRTKARLQNKMGDTAGAEKSQEVGNKYFEQFKSRSKK